MTRAADSPLRDYMLSLHRRGIKVTFCKGNEESPGDNSQFFRVEMPSGVDFGEYEEILTEIAKRVDESARLARERGTQKLTRQVAASYVSKVAEFRGNKCNKDKN